MMVEVFEHLLDAFTDAIADDQEQKSTRPESPLDLVNEPVLCFSRSTTMHAVVIGLFINRDGFGSATQ